MITRLPILKFLKECGQQVRRIPHPVGMGLIGVETAVPGAIVGEAVDPSRTAVVGQDRSERPPSALPPEGLLLEWLKADQCKATEEHALVASIVKLSNLAVF